MIEENGIKFAFDTGSRREVKFYCMTLGFSACFPVDRTQGDRVIVVARKEATWNGQAVNEQLKQWVYDKVEEVLEEQGYRVQWDWPAENLFVGSEGTCSWYLDDNFRLYIEFFSTLPKLQVDFPIDRNVKEKHIVVFREAADWHGAGVEEDIRKWVEQRIEEHFKRNGATVVWDDRKVVERVPEPVRWAPHREPDKPPGCLAGLLVRMFRQN